MVMPQFPLPSYMEAPAYVVPTPPIQPVDYRRLLHPQHVSTGPYHHPNLSRRVRLPLPPRQSVNSAVQTETPQRSEGGYNDGSPPVRPDSGHETASSSPASSSTQKEVSVEDETVSSTTNDAKILTLKARNSEVKHGYTLPYRAETKAVHSGMRATVQTASQKNVCSYRSSHCNICSGSSPDSVVPFSSSSQQDAEVVKERRVSFPDILMSWGGCTSQDTVKMTDGMLQLKEGQLPSYQTEIEHERSGYQHGASKKNDPVVLGSADATDFEKNSISKDDETLFKILKLPLCFEHLSMSRRKDESVGLIGSLTSDELLHSSRKNQVLSDNEQRDEINPHDITGIIPYETSLNSCQMNRKMSESVWSVESLAPFIPTREWMLQTGMPEPEIIIETTEEAENVRLTVKSDRERRWSRRFSSSDLELNWPFFSTPAEKLRSSMKPETEKETKQGHSMVPLLHPTGLTCQVLSNPAQDDMDDNGSSEPEVNQSPGQQCVIIEQQEKRAISETEEDPLLNSAAEKRILATDQLILQNGENEKVARLSGSDSASHLKNEQLCVPAPLLKGNAVDCSTQCNEMRCSRCGHENLERNMGPSRSHSIKYSGNRLLISTTLTCLLRVTKYFHWLVACV